MAPKLTFSWPATLSAFFHLTCFTLHPYLTYTLLTHYSFTYPATLSLIQVSTTAVCLWFWALFGLYRIRSIPLLHILPLSASAAALALLALFTLASTSLLVFQTARLVSAVLVLSTRNRQPLPGVIALAAGVLLVYNENFNFFVPLCYTIFASVNALLIHPFAARIKASELQLQVLLRTLASGMLLPVALILDNLTSPETRAGFAFDDSIVALILTSGLVAFLSFASSRASVSTLNCEVHTWVLLCSNIAVFACHFLTGGGSVRVVHVLGVLGLSAAWLFLAEKRKLGEEENEQV